MSYSLEDRQYDAGRVDLLMAAVVHLFRARPDGALEFRQFATDYLDAAQRIGLAVGRHPSMLGAGEAITAMRTDIESPGQFDSHLPSPSGR